MNRTCDRHARLRTAVHPVTRTWLATLAGAGLSASSAAGALDHGPVVVTAVFVAGIAVTGWLALRVVTAHSDGDDIQVARAARILGPHFHGRKGR